MLYHQDRGLFNDFRLALSDAFSVQDIQLLLRGLGRGELDEYASPGIKPVRIDQLVHVADQGRWLDQLINAACAAHKERQDLKDIKDRLQPFVAAASSDPYEVRQLPSKRVFINRKTLRAALRNLASPNGARVLVVYGPPEVGKTYSFYLIDHIARHPKEGGFEICRFDLENPAAPQPGELAFQIVLTIGGDAAKMPSQGPATSTARWTVFLLEWVVAELKRLDKPHYLVFDGFSKVELPDDTHSLITGLAQRAQEVGRLRDLVRVVLLSYSGLLHPDINDFVQREAVEQFGLSDMVELVIDVARELQKQPHIDDVKTAVQNVLNTYPVGTKARNYLIGRGLIDVIETVLKAK